MTFQNIRNTAATLFFAALAAVPAAHAATVAPVAPTSLLLHDGAAIRLRLVHGLTFAGHKPGEIIELEVLDDLRLDGILVIGHGTKVTGTIIQAEPKSKVYKSGKLGVSLENVQLLNAVKAPIHGPNPEAPQVLVAFAPKEDVPEGAEIVVHVAGDLTLDPATFLEDIQFTSNPPGAMVTMYGAPVGRTPFTTRLAPGSYKAIFSASGYTDVQQTVTVGPGHPTVVNAAIEMR